MAAIDLPGPVTTRWSGLGFSCTRVARDDRALVLVLTGEFDLAGVSDFTAALEAFETAPRSIVIDIEGLSFIDMAGIRALQDARERSAGVRSLTILAGSGPTRRTFALVGLDDLLGPAAPPSAGLR